MKYPVQINWDKEQKDLSLAETNKDETRII